MTKNDPTSVRLKDLTGNHILDAVERSSVSRLKYDDGYEQCQMLMFRLDGVVYAVIDDPSDGYRSAMRELRVGGEIKNTFSPVRVVGKHLTDEWDDSTIGGHDILQLVHEDTGRIILEVGTAKVDDGYPCFLAYFNPEALR